MPESPSDTPPAMSPSGRPPARRRPPPRLVKVVALSRLTPRLVSVLLSGDDLDRFKTAAPTSHIKVFFPAPGQAAPLLPEVGPDGPVWPEGVARPIVRTYTPRRFDDATGALEVQFVLHGEGPASQWAEEAKVGDRLAIAGPGGRFSFDPEVRQWWIGGDESALPAIGTLLDALPVSAVAELHVEVDGPEDEIDLPSAAQTTVTWHHRTSPEAWGAELNAAAHRASIPDGARVWVACEATAVRRIRRHFLTDLEVPVSAIVTRGYWRLGIPDHPDHDYGEDA